MAELFLSGGVMMWPMALIGVGLLIGVVRVAIAVARGDTPAVIDDRLRGLLFWGGTSFLLGLLGTVVGQIQMARVIASLEVVNPSLVWGGMAVSLVTLVFGLLLLIFALCGWYGLRLWADRAVAT